VSLDPVLYSGKTMNAAIWVLFGIFAGVIGEASDSIAVKGGLAGSIAAGILGALLGGFLATSLFRINTIFDLPSFIIAVSLSLFVILAHRTIFSKPLSY
jgi:uncharacterized membrane protein YeaQ/YmgE (transglycosylase-associated protein family)